MTNFTRVTFNILMLTLLSVVVGLQGCSTLGHGSRQAESDPKPRQVQASFLSVPLSFEANEGQTDSQVKFLSRGPGYGLFLTPSEAVLALRKVKLKDTAQSEAVADETSSESAVLRMRLIGANPTPELSGETVLPGKVNYFIGNDPQKWRTNVPTYGKARYENVYPGIDLIYYGNQRQLEYDFVVAPGQDPASITMAFEGAERLEVDASGDLVLQTSIGEVRQRKPIIYQEVQGERQEIGGSYLLRNEDQIGFQVAAYDATKPLIIDPILVFSTYLGGSELDRAGGIALDGTGQAYIAGITLSVDFPTPNPPLPTPAGSDDVFVAKLAADGSALLYATFLGGSDQEGGPAIAVDSTGKASITGLTRSTDFPTQNPLQPTNAGPLGFFGGDAFVAQLVADGSALVYATYLGGSVGQDEGLDITVDRAGVVTVTGRTESSDFPTQNALQPAFGGGDEDAFVAQLSADGSALSYSTFLGGSNDDQGAGIALDDVGQVYVTGSTESADFPTQNPVQPNFGGGDSDAFVAKLAADGAALVFSTFLGGSGSDSGGGITVDEMGEVYIVGTTGSNDFPTQNPLQPNFAGGFRDAFVAQLTADGAGLVYSTYLGGSGSDSGGGITVDEMGEVYIVGTTGSNDFPTQNPLQPNFAGGFRDAFVAQLTADGAGLVYSTYLGGSGNFDEGNDIALHSSGLVYVTGDTDSQDFPTQNALQPTNAGPFPWFGDFGNEAFVAKIETTELRVPQDFATIQEAINIATADTAILVGPGTYDEEIDFQGKKLVLLSTNGPGSTSLRDVSFTNNEPEGTMLDGFRITGVMDIFNGASPTIKNCQLDASQTGRANNGGHGSIDASSPTFIDCEISGGEAGVGGGFDVRNGSFATFNRCTFFDNTADEGAALWISSDSKTNLTDGIVRTNHGKGALHNEGELALTTSFIQQNDRIGLINHGTGSATVNRSSIVENHQHGIQHQDNATLLLINSTVITLESAGLQVEGGTVDVVNSTFSGRNQGHPGIGVFGGELSILSSTISDHGVAVDGGGIGFGGAGGTVTLQNTILAGNSANVGPDCDGPVTSRGNNIIGDPSGCTIALQPTDLTGNPGLDAFADDVTPGRGHFPLLPTSQAIDEGNSEVDVACLRGDQLGNPRVDGGPIIDEVVTCDIGAIESQTQAKNQNLNDKFAPLGPGDVGTAFSFTPCGGASAGTFTITATFTNTSLDTLFDLLIAVQTLTGGNVLCNADGGPAGKGATLTVPLEGDLADGQLNPGESFVVELPIGLQSFNPFTFEVDVGGAPTCPCVGLQSGDTVWADSYATLSCTDEGKRASMDSFELTTRVNSSVAMVESLSTTVERGFSGDFRGGSCNVGQTEIGLTSFEQFTACQNSLHSIAANDGVACVGP